MTAEDLAKLSNLLQISTTSAQNSFPVNTGTGTRCRGSLGFQHAPMLATASHVEKGTKGERQKDFSDRKYDFLVFCLLPLFSLQFLEMKVLTLHQEGLFPVVPVLMDENEAGQLSFIVSFNSICNGAGRNTLGLRETGVSISAL